MGRRHEEKEKTKDFAKEKCDSSGEEKRDVGYVRCYRKLKKKNQDLFFYSDGFYLLCLSILLCRFNF